MSPLKDWSACTETRDPTQTESSNKKHCQSRAACEVWDHKNTDKIFHDHRNNFENYRARRQSVFMTWDAASKFREG
jgi:hypothetical protein